MNGLMKMAVVGLGVLALAACETASQNSALYSQGQTACGTATGFNAGLCTGYAQLAREEGNPYADYRVDAKSVDYYSQKAIAAGAGDTVLPTMVAQRTLPAGSIAEVTDARSRLMAALDGNGRTRAAQDAAMAQTNYDCWLEQLEEDYQPQDIARCRQNFLDALGRVEAALRPAPPPPPVAAPAQPEPFLVFFDFDRATITPESARIIRQAADRAKATGAAGIQVIGYTDRSGSVAYNLRLSVRRANAVKDELVRNGIPAGEISVEGRGEADPLVPTADGVREPQNRRAEGIWIFR